METKLYIGSELADVNGNVPVEFCQCDIRNLQMGSVQSSYDIDIPLTKKNKELIKYSDEPNVFDEITEVGKLLYKDIEIFRGAIRQLKSEKFYSSLIIQGNDWMEKYDNLKLADLDLSLYDEVYNSANVQASWSAVDPFIRYPLINWGKYALYTTANATRNANDFVPWFNLRKILLKVLKDYTIVSTFLSSDYFKSIYILSKELCQESSFITDKALEVYPSDGSENRTTDVEGLYTPGMSRPFTKTFNPILFGNEVLDDGADFLTGVYTIPETGTYRIQFHAQPRMQYTGLTPSSGTAEYLLEIRLNGIPIETLHDHVDPGDLTFILDTEYRHFVAGDLITCYCQMSISLTNNTGGNITAYLYMSAYTKLVNVLDGYCLCAGIEMTIEPEKWLPDVKQSDFIAAVKHLFNLQFFLDKWNNTLYIEPLEQWRSTHQINLDVINQDSIKTERISGSYNKLLTFEFNDDSTDRSLTDYNETNKTKLGRKIFTLTSGYAEPGEKIIKNNLFSTFYVKSGVSIIWGEYDKNTLDKPQSRATSLGTKIGIWAGTIPADFLYDSVIVHDMPMISQMDFTTLFLSYYAKTAHYIDTSKIVTIEIKTDLLYLQQFITVIEASDEEGFRPEYIFTIEGETYLGYLNRISFDGERALMELIIKV